MFLRVFRRLPQLARTVTCAVPMLVSVCLSLPAQAQQYSYQNIVDTTVREPNSGSNPFSYIDQFSFNDSGVVAFIGGSASSSTGVYLADATRVRRLDNFNSSNFSINGQPTALNNNGVTAFYFSPSNGAYLFTGAVGRSFQTIVQQGGGTPLGQPYSSPNDAFTYAPLDSVSISDNNFIGFVGVTDKSITGRDVGAFVTNGTTVRVLSTLGQAAPSGGVFGLPLNVDISENSNFAVFDSNQTGFYSGPVTVGLYRYTNPTLASSTGTLLVGRSQAVPGGGLFSSFSAPTIANDGTTAFWASITNGATQGVFVADAAGTVSKIAAVGDSLPGEAAVQALLGLTDVNQTGTVAFATRTGTTSQSTVRGIYTAQKGASGTYDAFGRVVGVGDALFGSTVTALRFSSDNLNNAGQVAFRYTLANGRQGIAIASPSIVAAPEPGTLALLSGVGMFGMFSRRRKRTR